MKRKEYKCTWCGEKFKSWKKKEKVKCIECQCEKVKDVK